MKIIADAGATSTKWCVSTKEGQILYRRTGGLNFSVGRGIADYVSVADDVLRGLSLPDDEITEIWFYGAGLVSADSCREWAVALSDVFRCAHVQVCNDLVGAARAVLGNKSGIACILGTGSNTCLWNGKDVLSHIHPGGYILGDEGSGAYMGRVLLSDFIKGMVPEPIARMLESRYGLDYADIVDNIYKGQAPSRYLASFAPFISENIDHPYCRGLVSGAFDAFIQRNILPYGEEKSTLAFVGSIAEEFREILRERVEAAGFEMGEVMASPADGLVRYHFGL